MMQPAALALAAALLGGSAAAQTLNLSGEAGQHATLSAAEFAALPHVHVQVTQHGQPHAFDGVLLSDLLSKVGAPPARASRVANSLPSSG
jgi:hypothetical protein